MPAKTRVRFGIFDFQPATGELRREGVPVRVQPQPAQVLGLLLANAGDVVTRETLREALWGNDTHVDFDRGLNFCIAQIRSALGDSADSPRFIRTVPKRGYQFIAPIGGSEPTPPARNRLALTGALIAVPCAALVFAALGLWLIPSPPITRIAVARFDNQTDDPHFDRFADALTDSVTADLSTSGGGRYGVIGNAAILRRPRQQRDLLAIGASLQARYVILGQVQKNGPHIRVLAHLIRLPDQTHVWVDRFDRVDNPDQEQPRLASRISTDFSNRIAASPASSTR